MSDQDDSLLRDLAKLIPGYGAYLDQESRRSDDRRTRDFLVQRLGDCKAQLDKLGKQAATAGNLDLPAKLEVLRARLDHAQRRLSAAVEGYAAWFGDRTVDAELLEQVAKLDAALISVVDQLDALGGQLEAEPTPGRLEDSDYVELLDLLHQRIDRRSQLIVGGSEK